MNIVAARNSARAAAELCGSAVALAFVSTHEVEPCHMVRIVCVILPLRRIVPFITGTVSTDGPTCALSIQIVVIFYLADSGEAPKKYNLDIGLISDIN
eukprot:317681-Pleurochrysis_carterae.AAC.2